MPKFSAPPAPPKQTLENSKRLELYKQMLIDLEAKFEYQENATAYHSEALKSIEAEAKSVQAELEACKSIIQSLEANVDTKSSSNGRGKKPSSTNTTAKKKASAKTTTKTKATNKTKVAKQAPAKKTTTATKSKTAKASSKTKASPKATKKAKTQIGRGNKLPPSTVINSFSSITEMVLDFASKQERAISADDLCKYAYPKGLKASDKRNVLSSFSSSLGLQSRKGRLKRTAHGWYESII